MSLKDVFCQDMGIGLLRRAFAAGRVPHAYIFAGLEGVGKFKTAWEWGKVLLCKNAAGEDGGPSEAVDSCGECESCRAIENGSHPDFNVIHKELIEFTKDGKNKKPPVDLPIDVIREFVVDKVSIRPSLSQRKVYILNEAERLNTSSQNCLLKVLEEPPGYCCIILVCTRLEKLLPTTRSRCQIVRFGPVDEEIIFEKLKEMGVERKAGRYFARLSQGSLGLACSWGELEKAEAGLYQTGKDAVDLVVGLEYAEIPETAAALGAKAKALATAWAEIDTKTSKKDINRRAAKSIVRMVISALDDAMKLGIGPQREGINFEKKKQIERLAGRFEAAELAERIADCYEMLRWIESSVNEKLIFEQLLFSLADSDRMPA